MKTENLEKMQALKAAAQGTGYFWQRFDKLKSDPRNDKIDARFVEGKSDRSACFTLTATFEAYCGTYGSSSVYTMGGFHDGKLAASYVVKAMNNLKRELFAEAAELMAMDAAKLEAAARAELSALAAMVDEMAKVVEPQA